MTVCAGVDTRRYDVVFSERETGRLGLLFVIPRISITVDDAHRKIEPTPEKSKTSHPT